MVWKKIIIIAIAVTTVSAAAGLVVSGRSKAQRTGYSRELELMPINGAAPAAGGTVSFREERTGRPYLLTIEVEVINLSPRRGRVFEVWLAGGKSGGDQSLGVFQTGPAGRGGLRISRSIKDLSAFRELFVTSERAFDSDPRANGTAVLTGDL